MTVAMPSHRRKGKHGVVNTQVQSRPLLRRGFGTSVPFHSLVNNVCGVRYSLGYRIHSDTGPVPT